MYLGAKEIKECPHKTVSRFYNSLPVNPAPEWRCDWCGQVFSVAEAASKTVELKEVGTVTTTFQPSAVDDATPDPMPEYAHVDAQHVLLSKPAKKKDKSFAS